MRNCEILDQNCNISTPLHFCTAINSLCQEAHGGANIPTVRVGQSGDYGADLLANTATVTAVIQCKFYAYPVGYDAVKEAYTAKAIYHATAAFVVSNATFTTQARRAARQLGVILANHAEIAALLKSD